ncbi:unnamed protein product [Brachionus calyciflorus]|uniref:CCDC66 domain-containing protein n=1 Tax=Brachionus calyciflorus TaxID=104777 RepID=A0A814A4K7_9BILA|nr:unnamed protein product [Brachionus calyciflorus]
MQFETRIIDGKPSIFYKDDAPKTNIKKPNTKNKQAKKDIHRSMDISGEIDMVKPSPRQINVKNTEKIKSITNVLNQNGIKLTPDQLINLISQVQTTDTKREKSISRMDTADRNGDSDYRFLNNKSNLKKTQDQDFVNVYRPPQIVIAEDDEIEQPKPKPIIQETVNANKSNDRMSLIEKKKLKWQQDKEMVDKLNQQENQDNYKFFTQQPISQNNFARTSSLPRSGLTPEPPIGKISLAEKKRLQWQQEKDAQENLKKFPGPINDLSNYRQTPDKFFQNEIRKSNSLNNLIQNQEYQNYATNDVKQAQQQPQQQQRYSLMEKKKQKWNLEKENNNGEHWPYGKPGVGVGRIQEQTQAQVQNRPKTHPDPFEEFNKIKEQIEAITATENKIKNEQILSSVNQRTEEKQTVFHDQIKVPAAMRTSIMFGGVMYDDEIKKTKELERKKWLADLEEQKKEKLIESQRATNTNHQTNNSAPNPPITPRHFEEEKNFGRTRNLLDPAQIEELERKKKQSLQHKMEIEAQIAEKKRIKMLEEEIQTLNNLKIENEAKEIKETNQFNEELKKNQIHYQNFEKILNSSRHANSDVAPSVLLGENNKFDQESKTVRSNITDSRSNEIYRKMQEAELAAAEEKHKKLLKRLQKGGHDTTQLERKFAETKARLTGNPIQIDNPKNNNNNNNSNHHQISNIPGLNFSGIESSRVNNNTSQLSVISDHENRLERQKELLAKKVLGTNKENEVNTESSRIQKIFQLLREDTTGLPAEITEEDLKILLKNVVKTEDTPKGKQMVQKKEFKAQKKEEKKIEEEPSKSGIGKDGKPIWNYKNLKGRKVIKNSEKDPFYHERAQKAEERKRQRLEYYQNLSQKNGQKYKEFTERKQQQNEPMRKDSYEDHLRDNRTSVVSSMSNASTQYDDRKPPRFASNSNKQQTESIMNLLTKNLASNPIYEEDEDMFLKETKPKGNYDLQLKNSSFSSFGDSNRGFVPFMRTNEVLDPVHAGSPVPPSRESSAIKRDREKARQAYIQNMKPSDYGFSYDDDPLLNNGLVRNNPTPRQEQILSQLASLKQSLIQKQKEIASSITYDSNDNYE